ncbi:MAG: dTMP kinase [Candidatus Saccharibacteria bacterium]
MPKGKLIVIDGTDGSGKATQTKLLVSRLRKNRIPAEGLDFPQYRTFFGKLVARYLKNEFGRLNPYLAAVLYADNRLEFKDKLLGWLAEGRTVVLNRYVSSNQIHQAAHLTNRGERHKFVKWISEMEYKTMGLPRPDLVIYLNMPPETAYQLILRKDKASRQYINGDKRDMLESDLEHQRLATRQAIDLLNNHYNWTGVNCTEKDELRTKQAISDDVWQAVAKLLKFKTKK